MHIGQQFAQKNPPPKGWVRPTGRVLLKDQPELLADMKVYAVEVVLVSLHCSLSGSLSFVVLKDLPSLGAEELVVLSAEFLVHARV